MTTNILEDKRITDFGLLIEATRRLTRTVETSLRNDHGLTVVEFEAMVRLGRSTDRQMSMTEMANQMVLTSGGVTRLIDRLAGEGFVDRVSCPSDRRVQWAHLTEDGEKKVAAALVTHLGDLDEHFLAAMSATERTVMVSVLDRLRTTCGSE